MSKNWKEITTTWKGGMAFVAENAAGAKVQMGTLDGNPGIGPMEMLLTGLAGCTGMDIIAILEKKRAQVQDMKINVRGLRADTYPMVYTDIEIEFLIWGENLKSRDVEQAIHLSEDKYCSVGIMLAKTANIKSTYKILAPGVSAG